MTLDFLRLLFGLEGHEADDDMGHTEVAKSPAKSRDNVLPGGHEIEVAIGQRAGGHDFAAAHEGEDEDGSDQQRRQHEKSLEEVRPAHGGEAAQEGVGDDDKGRDVHGHVGVDVHHRVEQRAAGLDAGGGIDGVGHQEDHRANDLHELALGEEAVGEILRDGDRVPGADGEAAQPRRLKIQLRA